jgi:hypothetical protein
MPVSATDIHACLSSEFAFLLEDHDCALRHVLLESVRSSLEELDALDRSHPIWAKLIVQTVNYPRLQHIVDWELHRA